MPFTLAMTDAELASWLAGNPTEDELRDAYLRLEAARASLWTPGHIDSFRRDRYDLDSTYIDRLVHVKWALARHWANSGQFDRLSLEPTLV